MGHSGRAASLPSAEPLSTAPRELTTTPPALAAPLQTTLVAVIAAIRFYRESLARYLADMDGITVLGSAGTPVEAEVLLEQAESAIVLFDVARVSDIG